MQKIIILICLTLFCSCTKKIEVQRQKVEILQLETTVEPIKLQDIYLENGQCLFVKNPQKEVYCISKENVIKNIQNYQILRIKYNSLLQIYETKQQYYEKNQKILNGEKI